MSEYLMGIDAGTGSVRVALFDFRGQNRAYAVAEYGTTYPKMDGQSRVTTNGLRH